jgi:hypothetical protein
MQSDNYNDTLLNLYKKITETNNNNNNFDNCQFDRINNFNDSMALMKF